MGLILKVLKWIPLNIASILGIVQAVIKFLKEVITAAINILFPVIPAASFQKVVMAARKLIDVIDGWVEKLKGFLLAMSVLQ